MSIKTKLNFLSIIFIIIMLVSWILNFGWLRLTFTLMLVPVIHPVIFYIANNLSSKYINKDIRLKILTILNYSTFLLPHLLISDTNDCSNSYSSFFFGLIENSNFDSIFAIAGEILFFINIAIIILQFIIYSKKN